MADETITGLDLEPFLRLLRADVGAWLSLAVVGIILALLLWTSWGSRRALRKCLVFSIVVHFAIVTYNGGLQLPLKQRSDATRPPRIQQIRVTPKTDAEIPPPGGSLEPGSSARGQVLAAWERPLEAISLVNHGVADVRPKQDRPGPPLRERPMSSMAAPGSATPEPDLPEPSRVELPSMRGTSSATAPPVQVAPANSGEIPDPLASEPPRGEVGEAPGPDAVAARSGERGADAANANRRRGDPVVDSIVPDMPFDRIRPREPRAGRPMATADRGLPAPPTVAFETAADRLGLPALEERARTRMRSLSDVPEVYRLRLDPDRSSRATRSGANVASERAVEMGLDWLARHQDADGRWNAGSRKDTSGSPARGETDFTMHCPPGEICSGDGYYFDVDTAMTGLSLLAYLGAGHTHTNGGKYANTVERGIDFLLASQKANGDLRGPNQTVGMYCHAMATLALCEAFALTGDERLRKPVERGVDWLLRARSADGQAWRYLPGMKDGDTSILGWVVMVLKSAKEVGIEVPSTVREGALQWLSRVADGNANGLAMYRPGGYSDGGRVTPTMTAEAWVCRQFLGVEGNVDTVAESASYLLRNPPRRDAVNLYYWYYATLALYQNGGPSWERWNALVRDQIVALQTTTGHKSGSWDPAVCRDRYDSKGGRIYTTAIAILTLEVYYRYLRLYDAPKEPGVAPADPAMRRARR